MKLLMSTQFKKDLKRYQNKPRKIAALKVVLKSLSETGIVPDSYYPHPLHGDFKRFMECHVEGDMLLLWFDVDNQTIKLARLGSHSEVF